MASSFIDKDEFLPAEVKAALAAPDRRLGRFRLEEEVGRGGMAAVFRAHDPGLDRVVALKILRDGASPGEFQALLREAVLMAPLRHPSIVTVYECDSIGGTHYLEVDFVDGKNLAHLRDEMALPTRLALLEKVARVVHFVHGQGLIHRDLKPSNILVTPSGEPVLNDFGLAWPTGDDGSGRLRRAAGTPFYMAPEQVAGQDSDLTPRTDIYALGVILYELLTGRVPFRGETAAEVYSRILHEPPIPIHRAAPHVPMALGKVCETAMAYDPEHRYSSAEAFADALASVR